MGWLIVVALLTAVGVAVLRVFSRRSRTNFSDIRPAVGVDKPDSQIRYSEASGEITVWEVALIKNRATQHTFDAWCFAKNELRTFRFDGVLRVVLLATGEVSDPSMIFQAYFPGKPIPAVLRYPVAWRIVGALAAYTRKTNGSVRSREREIMRNLIHTICARDECPDDADLLTIITAAEKLKMPVAIGRLQSEDIEPCKRVALVTARESGSKANDRDDVADVEEWFSRSRGIN